MLKIDSLTKKQEKLLPIFRDKWMTIGLSTEPADREKAESGIELSYKAAGLKKPKIVWCLSPLSSGLTRYGVCKILEKGFTEDSVWNSVRDSVQDSVWNSVGVSVRDSVWNSVRDSVRDSVWNSVGVSVRDSVWNSVEDSVRGSAYGQHDVSWLGFYDYFHEVLGLEKQTEMLKGLWLVAQSANWFIPHKNICWISERHDICKLSNGRIHSEYGPAIHYPDGFSVWALNGVRVPQSIVETPGEKIDAHILLTEKNAEVRREIVRKIGIERVCQKLNAKRLDKSPDGMYELLLLDLGDGRSRPYLKMRNPSVQTYHIEGVPPQIKTVEQACRWRNGTDEKPLILT